MGLSNFISTFKWINGNSCACKFQLTKYFPFSPKHEYRKMTAKKNKTMIDLTIHGTGSGFEMKLNYGKIGFSRISLNMVRVFLDNDPSGIVIKTSTGLPITRTLKAQIRPDGNLVWSTEKNSGDKSIDCIRNEIKQLHALCLKSYRSLIPVGGAGYLKDSNLARKVKR